MKVPPLLALLAYTAMLSCTGITDPVAGTKGGSETTNGTVVGLLVDENGMAVDSAVVQLSRTLDWNEASLDTGTRLRYSSS